jgi:hypothetical protein
MLNALASIPVISPIDITFGAESGALLLSAPIRAAGEMEPDYTIDDLAPPVIAPSSSSDPAELALVDIERASTASEYHDFEWWRVRIATIRSALQHRSGSGRSD